MGNSEGLGISHTGQSTIHTPHKNLSLSNVLHVPQISNRLLSVQKISQDNNVYFEFHPYYFFVKDQATQATLLQGPSKDGLYVLSVLPNASPIAYVSARTTSDAWHRRLGHPHKRVFLDIMQKFNLVLSNKSLRTSPCTSCHMGKASRLPLVSTTTAYNFPLELIALQFITFP